MDDKTLQIIAWDHEQDRARWERTNRRAWILNIILAVLLVGALVYISYLHSSFETVRTTQEVEQIADGNGDNRFVGGDYYGDETKD